MGSGIVALGEVNHIEHVSREAKAIAKLFHRHTRADDDEVVGQRHGEVDKGGTRQRHASRHRPQRLPQPPARGGDTAEDAADGERQHTDGAIDDAHHVGVQGQSALVSRVEEEGVHHLQQESLRQTVEEHEDDGHDDTTLTEKRSPGMGKVRPHRCCPTFSVGMAHGTVDSRTRQRPGMVEGEDGEECRRDAQGDLPGQRDVATALL